MSVNLTLFTINLPTLGCGASQITEITSKQSILVYKSSLLGWLSTAEARGEFKELYEASGKFQRIIQRKFNLEDLPGKIQNWYSLTYTDFIKELAKKKVKLSFTEETDWGDYFLQEAKQALALKSEIDKTDKEIDNMVYQL